MPKTSNEQILDAVLRHHVYVLRYADSVGRDIVNLLNDSEEEIARRIRDKLRSNKGLTTPIELRRLQSLQASIKAIRQETWEGTRKYLLEEMKGLAYEEPIILKSLYDGALPVRVDTVLPSTRMLREIVTARPFEGRLLRDWASTIENDDIRRIYGQIQSGMVAGETSDEIARRVVGSARLLGSNGTTEVTRRQAMSLVRTAVQHTANSARDAYFAENSDIIDQEQFVATLDSKTTPICRALDGEKFDLGQGPRPPLHFQCRSLRIAAIDGTLIGDRPAKAYTEKQLLQEYADKNGLDKVTSRAKLPYGHKGSYDEWARGRMRELTGTVPASTTYATWLKGQPASFQDDILGVTKGKLFREGGLTLDKFVDMQTGTPFTLKDLAAKHAEAFRAAGITIEEAIAGFTPTIRSALSQADRLAQVEGITDKWGYGDEYLTEYRRRVWGEQTSEILDGASFDAIDSPVMLRGITDKEFLDSNLHGDWVGKGIYGNGNYFASGYARDESLNYSDRKGWVYSAKLKPDARIISHEDLISRMDADATLPELMKRNEGRAAAYYDIDAIYVEQGGSTFTIVVNNKALVHDRRMLPEGGFFKSTIRPPEEFYRAQIDELEKEIRQVWSPDVNLSKEERIAQNLILSDKMAETYNEMYKTEDIRDRVREVTLELYGRPPSYEETMAFFTSRPPIRSEGN